MENLKFKTSGRYGGFEFQNKWKVWRILNSKQVAGMEDLNFKTRGRYRGFEFQNKW